jgi:integrase
MSKNAPKWLNGLMKVNDVYHYRFMYDGTVHKGSTRVSALAEAREVLRLVKNKVAMRARGAGPAATLEECYNRWDKDHSTSMISASHRKTVRFWKRHMQELLPLPADEITDDRVTEITNKYMNSYRVTKSGRIRPHTTGGLNDMLKTLRLVLGYAVERHLLNSLHCTIKKTKVQPIPRAYVPTELMIPFLQAVDVFGSMDVRIAVRMMLLLGLREKEAREAKWSYVDFSENTYTPGHTKSITMATIPMSDLLIPHLRELQSTAKNEWILPRKDGSLHGPGFTKNVIQKAGEAIGKKGLTPHRMRTSFATQMSNAGIDIKTIQYLMRHANTSTTFIYVQPLADGSSRAIMRLSKVALNSSDAPNE